MQKIQLFIGLILLLYSINANARRSMYVDGFASILGDMTAENDLLNHAQTHGIETLILYELHLVNASHNLANPITNQILADFIKKAKNSYGITQMGGSAENGDFFTNVIDAYNNSRADPLEKFDVYNLEFEYWQTAATGAGGYYCTTYLTPNGLPCTVAGAFQFYVSILQTMNALAANNVHPILTEAYVGWPSTTEAATIGANVDRLLLHAYVKNPNTAFNYSKARVIDFANGNPNLNVSIIYSAEPNFMQDWLLDNSLSAAESIYTTDWTNESANWTNNINLEGFTYFAYSFTENVPLPIASRDFNGQQTNHGIQLNWNVSNVNDLGYFEIERKVSNTNEFHSLSIVSATDGNAANSHQFIDKNPHNGLNYYRLKQVDDDGKSSYSKVIVIPYQQRTKIYPTLVQEMIFVESIDEIEQIEIYDTNGQKIKIVHNIGLLNAEVDASDLSAGMYLLFIKKAGAKTEYFRFIKCH